MHDATRRAAAERIASFVRRHAIPFARGEVAAFITRSNAVACAMAVRPIPAANAETSAYAKGLLTLWAVVVDDAIDRDRDRSELDESIAWLSARDRNTAPPTASGSCARILDELWRILAPQLDESTQRVLLFDLWEQALGLQYEALINAQPELAAPTEYRRFAVLVASIKIYVDVDLALAGGVLAGRSYRVVRSICDTLGGAIKYASDVGSLRRELWEEDNLNAVLLAAREAGAGLSQLRAGTAMQPLRGAIEATRAAAFACLDDARRSAARLGEEHDATQLLRVVQTLLTTYLEGDPFFGVDSSDNSGTLFERAPTA